jgi:hypothetical protein
MTISGGIVRNDHKGSRRQPIRRLLLALVLAIACRAVPVHAQQSTPPIVAAQEYATSFLDRMVQVRTQPVPNGRSSPATASSSPTTRSATASPAF